MYLYKVMNNHNPQFIPPLVSLMSINIQASEMSLIINRFVNTSTKMSTLTNMSTLSDVCKLFSSEK